VLVNLQEIFDKSKLILANGKMLITPRFVEHEETKEEKENLDNEMFNLLGVSFKEHPIAVLKNNCSFKDKLTSLSSIKVKLDDQVYRELVYVKSYRETLTKTKQAMAFAKIEDDTTSVDIVVFPGTYAKVVNLLKTKDKPLIATIKANTRGLQLLNLKSIDEINEVNNE